MSCYNFHECITSLKRIENANRRNMPSVSSTPAEWCLPPIGILKLNMDAGVFAADFKVSRRVVLHDSASDILFSVVYIFPNVTFPLHAKLLAIKVGLETMRGFGASHILVESDLLLAIQEIHNGSISFFEWFAIIHDILNLALCCSVIGFSHVQRSSNVVAHKLARVSYDSGGQQVWLGLLPDMVM
ncbi:hypothetical protein PTKIN_Ptkin05aG0068400 [Pterospermum kingtungense]